MQSALAKGEHIVFLGTDGGAYDKREFLTVCAKIMSSLMRGYSLAHWNLHGPRR